MSENNQKQSRSKMEAKASITFEAVVSDSLRSEEEAQADRDSSEDNVLESTCLSKEQILRVNIELSNEDETQNVHSRVHLVLVVDKSGSMAGQPWNQVKESLEAILGSCVNLEHMRTDLIVYNDRAETAPFTKSNYKEVIDGLKASGTTSFVAAFRKVHEVVSGTGQEYSQTIVVFLTDGRDTVSNAKEVSKLIPQLKEGFVEHGKQATVHSVGFSKDHDFKFLKRLAEEVGTCPGMFRYCEPGDDKQALRYKLDELFNFILQSDDRDVTINILDERCNFIGRNDCARSVTLRAKLVQDIEENVPCQVKHFSSDTWIYLEEPNDIPELSVSIKTAVKTDGAVNQISTPCHILQMERKSIHSAAEKTKWRLRILERNVDELMNQTSTAVAQKSDTSHLQARVEKYQRRIAHTRVFGNGISRTDRHAMFDLIKDVQTNLDQIQKTLAEYMRSGTDSISLLARAHDMRFQAVFNKSRRQRVMDKRASKNMQYVGCAQKELVSLVVDRGEIENLSQDALDFYFCVMSQNNVKDVLLSDDVEDAIGFGLAVKRSEVVLDEPTLIRIHVISGTLASRNAMLDALEYKINVSSHLKAHGGFQFDRSTLGVTTVGAGREPINAWLPLYVTKSHWNRIKVILKPALGSFCTLDPLGYHYKQMDVLFMVLGSMIGQLSDENIGEHQLKLLFSVLRTCTACLVDFDKTKEATDIVNAFVTSLAGRTKDIIPNLHTVIGYIVALPPETRHDIFSTEETIQKFWLAFLSEWLRRAAGSMYKESSLVDINGTINSLVNGDCDDGIRHVQTKKSTCICMEELEHMCLEPDTRAIEIKAFDPASEVKAPDIELLHTEEMDRAMEIWAEKHTGHQKNIGKTKKYKAALRMVNGWRSLKSEHINVRKLQDVTMSTEEASGSETDDTDNEDGDEQKSAHADNSCQIKKLTAEGGANDFDHENVTDYILKVIAKVQKQLTNAAYPSLNSLPGLITFVNTWLTREHDVSDMDANSGIAPGKWIAEVKDAVGNTYVKLKAEVKNRVDENAKEDRSVNETNSVCDNTITAKEHDVEGDTRNESQEGEYLDDYNVDEATDGDDDYDYYDSDDDDEIDYGYTSASRSKARKNKEKEISISLPQIIRFIDEHADVVQTLRAMLCQAVRFHSNSKARTAFANKELLDMKGGQETIRLILNLNYKYLEEFRVNARESIVEKALWKRANYCMIHSTSPWAFVGYLMNTYTSRNEGFSDLIDLFMESVDSDSEVPYLKEKVHVLLTGKYQDCSVIDNGNQWLPEKKMASKFKKLLGEETWGEFEMELRSSVQIHVYRESDIPNRHGHCNSNPYIPNVLRRKLGMKLLPEPKAGRRSRRRR